MAMHLEFVVLGPPISNQGSRKTTLRTWRAIIAVEARALWPHPHLTVPLKAIILNFYKGNTPPVDGDNMSKPIIDVMQQIVYADDRQITQAEIAHLKIGAAYVIAGLPDVLVNALQAGVQFVSVRIEDPVDPYPLPK